MHEASICEALLDRLKEMSATHGWERVGTATVRIGLLAGVVAEALEFAFEVLSVGTVAEGAKLKLEVLPGRFCCDHCGEIEVNQLRFICPKCGGSLCLLHAGRELLLCGVIPAISEISTP